MDDQQIGAVFRAIRHRLRLRQADVAQMAGVSQDCASRMERGDLASLRVETIRRIAQALGVAIPFAPRWRGPELMRLLDHDHAALVERVVRLLTAAGWEVLVEYSFNHFGDRGSVDVIAWRVRTRELVIIEVKADLVDMQDLHGAHDRKVRVVPMLLARERGWRAATVSRLLVVLGTTRNRSTVERHEAMFSATLPDRGVDVRKWLLERRVAPAAPLRGLWFVRLNEQHGGMYRRASRQRVRRPRHPSGERGDA